MPETTSVAAPIPRMYGPCLPTVPPYLPISAYVPGSPVLADDGPHVYQRSPPGSGRHGTATGLPYEMSRAT